MPRPFSAALPGAWLVRALVLLVLLVYLALTIAALDGHLQGDDHAVLWTSTSLRFGDLPNRDFFDGGVPLQVALSYVAQVLTGHRPLGEVLLSIAMRTTGLICLYLIALRASGRRLVALGVLTLVGVLSLRAGLYGAEKALIYPVAVLVAWRYLDNPRQPWVLSAVTAVAFLLRHDHGLYVGVPLALAIVLARRPLLPFFLGILVMLLPWLVWVQTQEGLWPYFQTRVEYARLAGIGVSRPGFGLPNGNPLLPPNALWILWQMAVLTVAAALATAAWLRDRHMIVFSVTGCLAAAGLMRELGFHSDSAALWMSLGAWLAMRAQRPLARMVMAAWAVIVATMVVAAAEPFTRIPQVVLGGGGLASRVTRALALHSALPAITSYAPPAVTDERLIVRYVYQCLEPGEHVWDAAQWFPLSYYSEHPVLQHPNWQLGLRRSHDAEIASRLRASQPPPLIVVEGQTDPYEAFSKYPAVQAFVKAEYEPITSLAMETFRSSVDNVMLLKLRRRQPVARYVPLDLPCFAHPSSTSPDVQ